MSRAQGVPVVQVAVAQEAETSQQVQPVRQTQVVVVVVPVTHSVVAREVPVSS
jgi:hypothetical protein